MEVPEGKWKCPDCGGFVDLNEIVCPNCAVQTHEEKQEEDTKKTVTGGSWAAKFMKGLTAFLWIGGLLAAIGLSLDTSGYGTTFSFSAFLIYASVYFILGGMTLCASELLDNVHEMAKDIRQIRTKIEE